MPRLDARAVRAAVLSIMVVATSGLASADPPQPQSLAVSVVNTPLLVAPPRHEAVTLVNLAESQEFRRTHPDGQVEPGPFVVPTGKEFILTNVSIVNAFVPDRGELVHVLNAGEDPLDQRLVYFVQLRGEQGFDTSNTNIEGGIAFAAGRRVRTNIPWAVLI